MSQPPIIMMYLEAGAYIAIMLAVIGVPQMLSSYFDIRDRRRERDELRAENERIRLEQEANAERRHQEMMAMLAALMSHNAAARANDDRNDQNGIIRAQQQLIADLTAEVAALRQSHTDGDNGA